MKLTKSKLTQLIKEELQNILNEGIDDPIVNKFRGIDLYKAKAQEIIDTVVGKLGAK